MNATTKQQVQVFVIERGLAPAGPPRPADPIEVEARTKDGLLDAARQAVAGPGRQVRSVSFTSSGLVAYVEETS